MTERRIEAQGPVAVLRGAVLTEVKRIFVGPDATVDLLLVALLAEGHVLIEGVPGLAKTTLAKALADALGVSFKRIQFTPDLLPADITGSYIFDVPSQSFVLRRGPIFAHVVLADEINRASGKTQSALLEAMQERQVTLEGTVSELGRPFMVVATENPIDMEGVYPLPEAERDRFLLCVRLTYPAAAHEVDMLKRHQVDPGRARAVANGETITAAIGEAAGVHVEDEILHYVTRLARATREARGVRLGVSPRAALGAVRAAKARAALAGRAFVTVDDVKELVVALWSHRMLLEDESESVEARLLEIREATPWQRR
jgi:MoxR-like ATPase